MSAVLAPSEEPGVSTSPETDITAPPKAAEKDPVTYLQDERFSQRFEMPLQEGQTVPFVVTYSDFGYRDPLNPQSERVLLFCSPLMGR
jgi:hypothetical protein